MIGRLTVLLLLSSRLLAQQGDYDQRLWVSLSFGGGWQGRGCDCQNAPSTDPASGSSFLGSVGATVADRMGIGVSGGHWSFDNGTGAARSTSFGAFIIRYDLWPQAGLWVRGGLGDMRSHDDALSTRDGINGQAILLGASLRWPRRMFGLALTADYVSASDGHQQSGADYQPHMLLLGLGLDVLAP